MAKKILKGLKRINIFPVTKNTTTEYVTGPAVLIPGAQSLSLEPEVSEWKIYADDTIYESGSDWNGMKMTLQLAELPLELRSNFEGGEWDETNKEYTYASNSVAPEIGMSFMSMTSDKQYRMVKLFSLRCTKVSGDYKTKGDGDKENPITIEGIVTSRLKDDAVKRMKDSVTESDYAWMETLDATTPSP